MILAHHPTRPRQRGGYTLVEMLVAAGVSLLIMVILTGAFQAGMDSFRKLRAQGNLSERLRMARTALTDDLSSPHFIDESISTIDSGWNKKDYVSYQDLTQTNWQPPINGFFRIWQTSDSNTPPVDLTTGQPLPFTPEGTDPNNLFFTRAVTHALAFTVRRRGAGPENIFRTTDILRQMQGGLVFPTNCIDPLDYRGAPDATGQMPFASQWAEVAWFLAPNGTSANGTPLFNLYRRQMVLIPPAPPFSSSPAAPANQVTSPPSGTPMPMVGNGLSAGNGNSIANENFLQPYNPEISKKRQFNNNFGPNYRTFYNRTSDVTQPRNRYGMLPAHDPRRQGGQQITRAQLAGVPDESPYAFGSALYNQIYPVQPYLPLLQDINQSNAATNNQADHQKFDNNDLVLTDVLSFEIKVLWDFNTTAVTASALAPHQNYSFQYQGQQFNAANSDYPYDYLPMSPFIPPSQQNPAGFAGNLVLNGMAVQGFSARVFDTWSQDPAAYGFQENPNGNPNQKMPNWLRTDVPQNQPGILATGTRVPLRIKVKAILIRLRVYDMKSEQTRQITILQDV